MPASQNSSAKSELHNALTECARRQRRNRLADYRPYPKQKDFHAAGAEHRERLLMAANQVGKTFCGGAEAAMHLTGRYPDWWRGRRFEKPVRAWAGSVTGEVTRDTVQRMLVGDPRNRAAWGEGLIPGDTLGRISMRSGIKDAIDGVLVRHESGGVSSLGFKTYEAGREKWQGETLDFVWFDEECPMDIYMEGLTRTNASEGIVYMTFTPIFGMSDVVHTFLESEKEGQSSNARERPEDRPFPNGK